jgi:hypothetical protein
MPFGRHGMVDVVMLPISVENLSEALQKAVKSKMVSDA